MEQGQWVGEWLKQYRSWGRREKLRERGLRRLAMATLEAAVQQAAQVDRLVKGLRAPALAGDAWDAMRQLALNVARGR